MVQRLAMVVLAATAVLGAPLLGQGDLTGEWEMTLRTQTGETTWQARFEQDGTGIGGEIDIGDREILSVDGTLDGSALTFTVVVPDLDGDQPISFEGEVSGDSIQGASGSFSWYGTGDWIASRE